MPGKPQWLGVATLTVENTREHRLIFGIYIDTTLALIDEGHKPPPDTLKVLFQARLTFITKTKEEPNNQTILNEIQKTADASFRHESYIEEQIIAIKNAPAMTRKASYATIASWGAIVAGTSPLPPTNALFWTPTAKPTKSLLSLTIKAKLEL